MVSDLSRIAGRRLVLRAAARALGAVFAALLVWQSAVHSPVIDEPIHIAAGLRQLRTGDVIDATHPPLARWLFALPVLALDVDLHLDDDSWKTAWAPYARRVVAESPASIESIVTVARIPAVALSLLLAWLVWAWAARLYGPAGGLLSLALLVFSPAVLGHGFLAVNDVAATLTIAAALLAFRAYLLDPSRRRLLVLSLAFAAAMLTKFTAVVLVPLLAVLYLAKRLLEHFGRSAPSAPRAGRMALHAAAVAAVTAGTIWAAYGFQVGTIADDPQLAVSRGGSIAVGTLSHLPEWVRTLPLPAYPFLKGLTLQLYRSRNQATWHGPGRGQYLLGEHSADGWWYYFPVAFALKTPLAFFLLAAGLAIALWRHRRAADRVPPSAEAAFEWVMLLVPIGVWFAACMSSTVNIGVRYLMPVVPFACVALGRLAPLAAGRRAAAAAIALAFAWYAAGTLATFPHVHSYFNEAAGGPSNGWRLLADSNLDWGEDLAFLRDYLREKGVSDAYIDYNGPVRPSDYGIPGRPVPDDPDALACVTGHIAVSVTNLTAEGRHEPLYSRLRATEPVARLGNSIFVFVL